MMSARLQEAHRALEATSAAATSVKDEEWGEAERALITVQELVARLLREASDKTQEKLLSATSEKLTEAKGRQCSPTNALASTSGRIDDCRVWCLGRRRRNRLEVMPFLKRKLK
jgi:hypothetical protein